MSSRVFFWIGTAAYAILAFLAVWYYKERVIFADASYQLFSVMRENDLAIQCNRYGVLFTQGAALIAFRLGFSLASIMITYSLSFVVLHWAAFAVSWRLRQPLIACTILFLSVFMMTYTFYWVQSEYIQGLVFMMAVFAWMLHRQTPEHFTAIEMALFPLSLITIVYFHPLLFLIYFFVLIYLHIQKAITPKLFWTGFWTVLIIMIGKSMLFKEADYDAQATSRLINFIDLFPNYFTTPAFKLWGQTMIREYYLVTLAWLAVIFIYIKTKQYLKLLYFLSAFVGYTLLINVNYAFGAPVFYLESHWLGLGIIVFLPFCWEVLPRIAPKYSFPIIALLLIPRLIHITAVHKYFTNRLDWYRGFMDTMETRGITKTIIRKDDVPLGTLKLEWAAPYEVLYLSSLERKKSYFVLIDNEPEKYHWASGDARNFLGAWDVTTYDKLSIFHHAIPTNDTTVYSVWKW